MTILVAAWRPLAVWPLATEADPLLSISSWAECATRLADSLDLSAVVCDLSLIEPGSENLLALMHGLCPDLPLVAVGRTGQTAAAADALERGAAACLLIDSADPAGPAYLTRLLRQAADQAYSRRQANRQARLFKVLELLGWQIATATDLAEVLQAAVTAIQSGLGYDYVAIYLAQAENNDLTLCAVSGADRVPAARYYLPAGAGTPGAAVASGRVTRAVLAAEAGQAWLPGMALEVSAPLWETGRVVGALTVACARPAAAPTDADLIVLASQLAAAMRNADSIRREVERAAREVMLTRISHTVNSLLSLEDMLQHAVDEIGVTLKVDRCVLARLESEGGVLRTLYEYINPLLAERRSFIHDERLPAVLDDLALRLSQGQVITCEASGAEGPTRGWCRWLADRYGAQSVIWVPVPARGPDEAYCLGLLQSTQPRHWDDDDINLLRGVADQFSLALKNAHLFAGVQATAAELQRKNAELEAFVYTVSHDLQAPVVSLRGFAALLQSRYSSVLEERGRSYVERIVANADYLSRLLQDLLELSRIGRREEPDEDLVVGEVVGDVLTDLSQALAERNVTLDLPPSWPRLRYSRTRLRQVFSNLLTNALKFLGPQAEPRIGLSWRRSEAVPGQLEFLVQDNGIGIHPDYHQRIFIPFERLRELEVEGTGVGLSIVKRIVEHRGGLIRLESVAGAGATFVFTVPEARP